MKSYLVVFFMLLSFWGFGQEEFTSLGICDIYFHTPDHIEDILFKQEHFTNFFPTEQMKSKGIRAIIIKKTDNDEIPTIHVGDRNYKKYLLNENGYLIKEQSLNYEKRFLWNDDSTLNKAIIYYNNDTTSYTFTYSDRKTSSEYIGSDNNKSVTDFLFDDKGRLIKILYNDKRWDNDLTIRHFEDEFYTIIEEYMLDDFLDTEFIFDTILYSKQKQFIKYIDWSLGFKEISVQITTFKYDENFRLSTKVISYEEVVDYTMKRTINHQKTTQYFYDTDGFLLKIIDDNNGCEESVHYYTE